MGQLPPDVTGDKMHGLNDTQQKIRQKGWSVRNPTMGFAYASKPPLPVRIKRVTNHYEAEVDKKPLRIEYMRVFLRLEEISTPKKKIKRKAVFLRLGADVTQRESVFDRLGRPTSRTITEWLEEEQTSTSCLYWKICIT
ncbi:hypothetical protein LIER_36214 [Lithospermum erythrorhizon]|uniref:Uncharacterized protein n=1 Tax=Lithospermum erythrorhizon TaxID=34254 RepID=A0AAV3P7C6_LITER